MSKYTANIAFRQLYGEYGAYARDSIKNNWRRFSSLTKGRIDQRRADRSLAERFDLNHAAADALPSSISRGSAFSHRIWATGFGDWAKQDASAGIAGYKYNASGIALGYDHTVSDNLILGLAGAYAHGKTNVTDLHTHYDSDIMNLGLNAAWFHNSGTYVKGGLGFSHGWNDYDTTVILGGKKTGDFTSRLWFANFELGREWALPYNFNVIPSIGVDFAYAKNGSWTEDATDTIANRFAGDHDTMLDIPATVRLNKVFAFSDGRYIAPEMSAALIFSAADRHSGITASYADASFDYRQEGVSTGRTRLQIGAGAKALLSKNTEARFDYTFEHRKNYRNHSMSAAVGVTF